MKRLLPLALLLPALACASAQAKVPVELAALEVPPVPPRLIAPPVVPEPPPPEPVVEAPPVSPPAPARSRPARDPGRSEPKAEAKPEAAAEPGNPPAPAPPPVGPLRVTGTVEGPEAERQVKEILARALKLIGSLDTRFLSEGRQADLEAAKNFITQAQDYMKASSWVLARSLAERAETLATLLSGRH